MELETAAGWPNQQSIDFNFWNYLAARLHRIGHLRENSGQVLGRQGSH